MPKIDPFTVPPRRTTLPTSAVTIDRFSGTYRWLSNFHPHEIRWDGNVWPTNEHAFQAGKTVDPEERDRIRHCASPGEAKRVGRAVTLRPTWESTKVTHMLTVTRLKYRPATAGGLDVELLWTGSAYLVEGNTWHDQIWGNCLCGQPACAEPGANLLGLILMLVRAELQIGLLR